MKWKSFKRNSLHNVQLNVACVLNYIEGEQISEKEISALLKEHKAKPSEIVLYRTFCVSRLPEVGSTKGFRLSKPLVSFSKSKKASSESAISFACDTEKTVRHMATYRFEIGDLNVLVSHKQLMAYVNESPSYVKHRTKKEKEYIVRGNCLVKGKCVHVCSPNITKGKMK